MKSCRNAERIRKGLAEQVVSREPCLANNSKARPMHDQAKEGYAFWLLMPDVSVTEGRLAAGLISRGLAASEVIEVLEKRRDGYDFAATLGQVCEQA